MRKHIKYLITILLLSFAINFSPLIVKAGSVTLSFKGNDTVKVNDNITITIAASNINGLTNGLATAQGDIIFDESYLEYVSFKSISSNLSVSYGAKTKRFVALGLGGEYVKSSDNLFTLTFKAKKKGQTKLNIKDVVIGDTKAIIHSSNIIDKTINIIDSSSNTQTTTPTKPSSKPNNNKDNNKSSDNKLSKLIVNNAKISPSFSPDVTSYNVVVSKDVDKLNLEYTTSDKKATVKVVGNNGLKDNQNNVVEIIVTAEDGTTNTYKLNVTKSDDTTSNKLILLNVKEGSLSKDFDSDTYEYSITVSGRKNKLTIDAIPESKDSKVEIIGNEHLGKKSVILIKVTDKTGYNTYYKLNVKQKDGGKLFGIDIIYIIIGLIILLFLIFLLLLLLIKRKKDKDEEEENNESSETNDDLYDDIVTKDELIDAIEEKNPKKLKMLLTQEKVNKMKEEYKIGQDLYDDIVTKEELINAIDEKDPKKLKMLLTQEKVNKLKEETNMGVNPDSDKVTKDELVSAIEDKDPQKLKLLLTQEEVNRLKAELKEEEKKEKEDK